MSKRNVAALCGLVVTLGLASVSSWGEEKNVAGAKPVAAGPLTVLDARSVWHSYSVLRLPRIQLDGGLKPMPTNASWLNHDGEELPAAWKNPNFDDSTWMRGSMAESCQTPLVSHFYLRGQFEVTDPAKVGDLHLSVNYRGGVIVYLNGQEVARGHLPQGALGPETLAEAYPLEAFALPDGKLVPPDWRGREFPKNLALRDRALKDVIVPQKLLRKGINVVAVECLPAPYNKVVDQTGQPGFSLNSQDKEEFGSPYVLRWSTGGVGEVRLTAAGSDGLVANVGRPSGVQVWNRDVLTMDYDTSIPDHCEPLRPVAITAARNGWFSGKVLLGSPNAIKGLKVVASDLKQGAATIPAAQVRLRYATAGGKITDWSAPKGATQLGYLFETPLAEFPASTVAGGGAVVPIWITVKVPKDAKTGTYTGQVTVTLEGSKPQVVPVKLDVADWTLPDTQDYRTWAELIESPDTIALEYKLDLWSDKHFELMAQAMDFIGEMGSRVVYVPLICGTNFGNEQSMVRWIKKSDEVYEWDFSIMDRYLDLAEKHMGKPKIVVFNVWDTCVTPGADYYNDKWRNSLSEQQRYDGYFKALKERGDAVRAVQAKYGISPEVTVLDPATKKVESQHPYAYTDPRGKVIWKALFAELRKRLAARGLEKAMMIGVVSDTWPTNEQVAAINEATGNLPWVVHSHGGNQTAGNAWFLGSNWPDRRARLFALAGEVAAKVGP